MIYTAYVHVPIPAGNPARDGVATHAKPFTNPFRCSAIHNGSGRSRLLFPITISSLSPFSHSLTPSLSLSTCLRPSSAGYRPGLRRDLSLRRPPPGGDRGPSGRNGSCRMPLKNERFLRPRHQAFCYSRQPPGELLFYCRCRNSAGLVSSLIAIRRYGGEEGKRWGKFAISSGQRHRAVTVSKTSPIPCESLRVATKVIILSGMVT